MLDAYEIRLLDDDESGKADMDMAAIDRNKSILSTQSEYFVHSIMVTFRL